MKVLDSRGNIFAHDEPNPTFCKCARKSVCARLFVYHRPCPVVLSARRGCCIALSVVPPSGGPSFNSPFLLRVFLQGAEKCANVRLQHGIDVLLITRRTLCLIKQNVIVPCLLDGIQILFLPPSRRDTI